MRCNCEGWIEALTGDTDRPAGTDGRAGAKTPGPQPRSVAGRWGFPAHEQIDAVAGKKAKELYKQRCNS